MSHIDDLMHHATELGVIQPLDAEVSPAHTLLVAPLGTAVPEDGMLAYQTFDKFIDLLSIGHGVVVLFREDQAGLLTILGKERVVFDRDVKALYGVPGTSYEPWFDDATFGLQKLSYSPLVSEIRVAKDVAAVKAANEPLTVVEREERQFRKADGSVRHNNEIGVAREGDDDQALD